MAGDYLYAGFRVDSSIALPPLASTPNLAAQPELRIERPWPAGRTQALAPEWLHFWREGDGSTTLQVARAPGAGPQSDRRLLRAPGQCDFLIDPDAGTIAVDGKVGLDVHTLEHLLLDQALPRLLAARGHLMAHASLVQIGAHCVAFLGRSGWGKSTLAGLLHRRGFTALCDDCARLDLSAGMVLATPAYPGMRLYADSIAQAFEDSPDTTPVADYSAKQRVIGLRLLPEQLAPRPLAALYLLDAPDQGITTPTLEPLTRAVSCMALVEHGFRLDPTVASATAQVLRQASGIADVIPTHRLRYPRDFDRSDVLLDLLATHFDQLESTRR